MQGKPDLWLGVECTINRVQDEFPDQVRLTGHDQRPDDLNRLQALGARAVRYPVLWERTTHDGWDFADERLGLMRELGLRPIAGLVHHGSGPPGTSLLDASFPEGLAAYAGQVAARFPWVEDYTPVNEPGTTARFAALYGHWYPHARDIGAFARALVHECRGTVLAMRAVRAVNPRARLIQTEDFGRILSTPSLRYQADYENQRRLLSIDLLCGRVDSGHPLWSHLRSLGIEADELTFFLDNPCPPDVIGLNYYLTSDRFLDDRVDRYPSHVIGGNGRDSYADVEAVRVPEGGIVGHRAILDELWKTYGLPLAITELHLGCSREEQLRWVREGWEAACEARAAGADVQAVTLWSAFGASDWDKLVTRVTGSYEPGLFDVRGGVPRPTALADAARDLAEGHPPRHPTAADLGWWRRPERAGAEATQAVARDACGVTREPAPIRRARPLVVLGAQGVLGQAFLRAARWRGLRHEGFIRAQLDGADARAVAAMLEELQPWAVINAFGSHDVSAAERAPERLYREHVAVARVLADACQARGVQLVTFSSDLVFDGAGEEPYDEAVAPAPVVPYGAMKASAEREVQARAPDALVVRTAALFDARDERTPLRAAMESLRAGLPVRLPDTVRSPTHVGDLAWTALDLLIDGERGVWHLVNAGASDDAELARTAATLLHLDPGLIEVRPAEELHGAPFPRMTALRSARAQLLRPLEAALEDFARVLHNDRRAA